jgi:ABC-2 type transport system ATP-binding protein
VKGPARLTLAFAKRPELMIPDLPVAGLDPLARREFCKASGGRRRNAVVSSFPPICGGPRTGSDYLVVLVSSRSRAGKSWAGVSSLAQRTVPTPAHRPPIKQSSGHHTERQSTLLVRTDEPIYDPAWTVEEIGLEDLVLAYMRQRDRDDQVHQSSLEVVR